MKSNIEASKRELYNYYYYENKIYYIEKDLFSLQQRIKDLYEAQGVSYDKQMNVSSSSGNSYVNELIILEASAIIEKKSIKRKKESLMIEPRFKLISKEDHQIIESIFKEGQSQTVVAKQFGYDQSTISRHIDKIVIKMFQLKK